MISTTYGCVDGILPRRLDIGRAPFAILTYLAVVNSRLFPHRANAKLDATLCSVLANLVRVGNKRPEHRGDDMLVHVDLFRPTRAVPGCRRRWRGACATTSGG